MIWFEIDRASKVPIIRQIYGQFREKILSGQLKAGERIPSSRELSDGLRVSRNVVLEAYDLLIIEGFIISKAQIGMFVAKGAVYQTEDTNTSENITRNDEDGDKSFLIDLRSGIPALDLLPRKKWNQIRSELCFYAPNEIFGYGKAEGRAELRNAISKYLQRVRGLSCNPNQIVITTGSIHSFSLISQILLKENKRYVIEDPLHNEIKKVLAQTSNSYDCVPVDEDGMKTELLSETWNPSFVLVTPSHQYPMGGCLTIQRRIELVEYAKRKNCYIIEDDYDSEFRYDGVPVSTLYSLDPKRVIYLGTFSKILFPSVRIGYLIIPQALLEECLHHIRYCDYFINTMDQLTMARVIDEFILEKHVSKMKKIYKKRRDTLIQCLEKEFSDSVVIHGSETGLHLVAEFKNYIFTEENIQYYYKKGLCIYPVWQHSDKKDFPQNLLIIGYSHLDEKLIDYAVKIIKN